MKLEVLESKASLHFTSCQPFATCVPNMCRLVAIVFLSTLLAVFGFQFQSLTKPRLFSRQRATLGMNVDGLKIDLRGKTIFVAGVADSTGYGWAIAKACAEAGARILLGTWPPVMPLFTMNLERGQYDQDMALSNGSKMSIAKIYPLDASFDDAESVPESVSQSKRYRAFDKFSISEVAEKVKADFGRVDGVVHALANGPEVAKPLLQTSRAGYLSAVSSSAFSLVSIARHFAPLMTDGGAFVSLSYLAAERAVAGYGGGMSSAKAALESDTRTLAYELGRLAEYSDNEALDAALTKRPLRINCISAGPLASRAAKAIGGPSAGAATADSRTFIEKAIDYSENNAPLRRRLVSDDVGSVAAFLLSDLSSGVTGCTLHVDNGLANMGLALDSASLQPPAEQ